MKDKYTGPECVVAAYAAAGQFLVTDGSGHVSWQDSNDLYLANLSPPPQAPTAAEVTDLLQYIGVGVEEHLPLVCAGDGLTLTSANHTHELRIDDSIVATVDSVEEKIFAAKAPLERKVSCLENEIANLKRMMLQTDPACELRDRVLNFTLGTK